MTSIINGFSRSSEPLRQPQPQPTKSEPSTLPKTLNVAQFAINQTLNKEAKQSVQGDISRLSLFKDINSGQYVSIVRNENGEVIEQIPDERILEFYARLEQQLNKPEQSKAVQVDV
jgi:uncharacterized FlaG/YvyC family protein